MSFSRRVAGLNLERRLMSPEENCYPDNTNRNPAEVAQTTYILGVSLGDVAVATN